MPARPLWKGHLRLSLVTIPVRVYPATNPQATIHFHQLHRECETRIQYKKWCPHHRREVTNDEIVKGYEFERGRYVALEDQDIAKVRPESTKVIHLRQFSSADAIDPMLMEQPYYLAPDGKVAAESFAVMREALKGMAGVGTVAFHGREHLVAIEPRDKVLIMFTLRRQNEIRQPDSISEIDAKIEGEDIITPAAEPQPRVVNLMDALRKSLNEVSKDKKRPARAATKPRRTKVAKFSARKRAS